MPNNDDMRDMYAKRSFEESSQVFDPTSLGGAVSGGYTSLHTLKDQLDYCGEQLADVMLMLENTADRMYGCAPTTESNSTYPAKEGIVGELEAKIDRLQSVIETTRSHAMRLTKL